MISNLRRAGDSLFEQKRKLLDEMLQISGVGTDQIDHRPNELDSKQYLSQTLDVVERAQTDKEDLQLSALNPVRKSRQNRISVLRISQEDEHTISPVHTGLISPMPHGSNRFESGLQQIDKPRYANAATASKPYTPASSLLTKEASK